MHEFKMSGDPVSLDRILETIPSSVRFVRLSYIEEGCLLTLDLSGSSIKIHEVDEIISLNDSKYANR
jgi:hypothetical protein